MPLSRRSLLATSLIAALPIARARAHAQSSLPRFSLEFIEPLAGHHSTVATGIATGGWVSGTSQNEAGDDRRVILYRNGVVRDRSTTDATRSDGFGVNKSSIVVGSSFTYPVVSAVAWDGDEHLELKSLGGNASIAYAINGDGIAVGYSKESEDGPALACKWIDGEPSPLSTPLAPSWASGINNKGEIVGAASFAKTETDIDTRAALWIDDELTLYGTLGGANSEFVAINDRGQIAGNALTFSDVTMGNEGTHAMTVVDGQMIDLGTYQGGLFSVAADLNNDGWIAGESHNAAWDPNDGSDFRRIAVLWANGEIVNLNDQVDDTQGWLLMRATGINDAGQICGVALKDDASRGFVLTPLEE
jgi:probable HAF family extracellular repeat protein